MATIRSLGVHHPAALQYLIDEGILPSEPNPKSYHWEVHSGYDSEDHGEEETVATERCVVYSTGGAIRKVFRFDIEEQRVEQAILTWFSAEEDTSIRPTKKRRTSIDTTADAGVSTEYTSGKIPLTASLTVRQKPGYGVQIPQVSTPSKDKVTPRTSNEKRARALVVILRYQAHIYFLNGPTHVVNLPFEVGRAFPAPRGLVLQRKIPEAETDLSTPLVPSAPTNSFLSPEALAKRKAALSAHRPSRRSQDRTGGRSRASFALDDLLKTATTPEQDEIPRHYVLMDPLSDVGLIVKPLGQAISAQTSSLDELDPLSSDEEIVHVSPDAELSGPVSHKRRPLIFVVTANQVQKTYCVYTASYVETMSLHEAMRKRSGSRSGSRTRRRSSFLPGTGATTPAIRPRDQPRESLSGQIPPNPTQESNVKQTAEETFASQVDPDYQTLGQPKKDSRRISSLLSRADLSTNQDRIAFHDVVGGHGQTTTTFGRRGPSLGMTGGRSSLTGRRSFARASTPGSTFSRTSFGGSDDETVADFRESGRFSMTVEDEGIELGSLTTRPFQDAYDGLKKELVLRKLVEIPIDKPGSFSAWTKSNQLHRPRIFTIVAPATAHSLSQGIQNVCLHIVQPQIGDHIEIAFRVQETSLTTGNKMYNPTVVRSHRSTNQTDAVKIQAGMSAHVASLHVDDDSEPYLSVATCWSPDMPVAKLRLPSLQVFNPLATWETSSPSHRTTGRRRTLDVPKDLCRLHHSGSLGILDAVEADGQHHRLQVQLKPQSQYVSNIMELCHLLLPEGLSGLVLVAWWEIMQKHGLSGLDGEWQALMTALLSLAVGHIPPPASQKKRSKSKTRSQRRSASLTAGVLPVNEESLSAMYKTIRSLPGSSFLHSSSWSWIVDPYDAGPDTVSGAISTKNDVMTVCIERARGFVASERGSALLSPMYSRGVDGRHDIPRILVALHLLREEQKLNVLNKNRLSGVSWDIGLVMAQLGQWLGWDGWTYARGSYYDLEGCGETDYTFEDNNIQGYPSSSPPPANVPPSILEWIETASNPTTHEQFPMLSLLIAQKDSSRDGRIPKALRRLVSRLTPRTVALSQFFEKLNATDWPSTGRVELMSQCAITKTMLGTLPESVLVPLQDALIRCQANPPTTWDASLLSLVGRKDLILLTDVEKEVLKQMPVLMNQSHSTRDVHTVCHAADQIEAPNFTSELERHRVAQLIFNEDRRYWEAEKLLNTLRPSLAECIPDPSWSEADILEAQKGIVNWVMIRSFSLAAGQSMFHYDSRRPLITEKFHIHGYNMSCMMKPMNITVSADRAQFTEEKYGWAWFHAGVSAGLSVSKHAEGIDTSWIVFNKPADLSNRHAGLLLGLGLNGHLRSIAKWLSFKYLTPKHTMTSIGLLLGLSVSFLGSMDALVTRLLSVHITRMLPPGAAELNLSPLTQTTGLMGIGLLYYATQHRRMSEIMLSEIEHAELQDPAEPPETLRDESYRLAAGFALGFINLGRGKDLRGLHDMRVVERLLAVAAGARQVDLIHILDQATAGAVIAVGLIFMKTHDKSVARKINIPDTLPQFDYVRPDILLLRTLAKHLIMWDNIKASDAWVRDNLPQEFSPSNMFSNLKVLNTEHLAFYNILAGLLWSISLRYAGCGTPEIRDFLIKYLDQLIRIANLPAHRYDAKLTRNTVRNCQDLVALSCATVMAGTGDLVVFRRLRRLHGRINAEVTYGSHMAAHMALGILFLGGGSYTLGTSNLAVASLVLAFYPLYPSEVTENCSHLQAFRHFWVLAAEARCLIVRDIDTKRAIAMPFTASVNAPSGTSTETSSKQLHAPCLLPPLSDISKITTTGPDHWPVTLDFAHNPTHLSAFRATQTVFVRRRPASAAHGSVFSSALVALNDAQNARHGRLMWHWLFSLPALADIDQTLWSSVLPPASTATGLLENSLISHGSHILNAEPDMIDERLSLAVTAKRSARANDLKDLKAVFVWAESLMRKDNGRLAWLGKHFIDRLQSIVEERGRTIAETEV